MGNFRELIMKRFSRDRDNSSGSVFRGCSTTGRESFIRRKLSIFRRKRTSSSVVLPPSSSIVVAGPSAASPPRSVPHQMAPEATVTTSTRPSSFSFLSRRFFSGGSRGSSSRGQTTIAAPVSTTNNHPPAGPSTTYRDGDVGGQTNDNGQQSSTNTTMGTQSPKGICTSAATEGVGGGHPHPTTTITGTISKSSAPANCTRGFKSSITVRVINIKGGIIDVTLPITKTGKELKLEAIGRFAVDENELQSKYAMTANNLQNSLSKYKLVTIQRRDVIDEDLTLERLGLGDKGEWGWTIEWVLKGGKDGGVTVLLLIIIIPKERTRVLFDWRNKQTNKRNTKQSRDKKNKGEVII